MHLAGAESQRGPAADRMAALAAHLVAQRRCSRPVPAKNVLWLHVQQQGPREGSVPAILPMGRRASGRDAVLTCGFWLMQLLPAVPAGAGVIPGHLPRRRPDHAGHAGRAAAALDAGAVRQVGARQRWRWRFSGECERERGKFLGQRRCIGAQGPGRCQATCTDPCHQAMPADGRHRAAECATGRSGIKARRG